jgi:hypothetical protein
MFTLGSLYLLTESRILWESLGKIEPHIAHAVGASHTRDVLFSLDSYKHIREHHPDITDDELLLMPDAVQHGEIVGEYRRDQWAVICYQHPIHKNKHYALPFRATRHGHQIFARTFHRMSDRQVKQLYRRGYPLRIQKQ